MSNTAAGTTSSRSGSSSGGQPRVWMADDDYNDHLFMLMAAENAGLDAEFRFLDDGTQLLLAPTSIIDIADIPDIPDMVAFARRIGQYSGSSQSNASPTIALVSNPRSGGTGSRRRTGASFDPTSLRFDPELFDDIEAALRIKE